MVSKLELHLKLLLLALFNVFITVSLQIHFVQLIFEIGSKVSKRNDSLHHGIICTSRLAKDLHLVFSGFRPK